MCMTKLLLSSLPVTCPCMTLIFFWRALLWGVQDLNSWSGDEPIPPAVEWKLRVLTTVPSGSPYLDLDWWEIWWVLISSYVWTWCLLIYSSPSAPDLILHQAASILSQGNLSTLHIILYPCHLCLVQNLIFGLFWNSLLSFRLLINSPIFHITLRLLCWSTVLIKPFVCLNACLGSSAPAG